MKGHMGVNFFHLYMPFKRKVNIYSENYRDNFIIISINFMNILFISKEVAIWML